MTIPCARVSFNYQQRGKMNFLRSLIFIFIFICPVSDARGEKTVYKAVIGDDGVQMVDILAGKYFFKPDHIIVKVNAPVELKVRKEAGIVPHSFVIKEPDAGVEVNESLSTVPKVITFTPKKAGKYPFYCGRKLLFFKSHREDGMEGVLEVTE